MPSREQLTQSEIDLVLGQYELGTIHSISELAAGSMYSPKVIIESDRGKLLLKRRARGLDLPPMVASSHEIIIACIERGLCVPPLLALRDGNSMMQTNDHIYELFAFIDGIPFDRSPTMITHHCQQAGALLGETHDTLADILNAPRTFEPPKEPVPIDLSRASLLDSFASALDEPSRERCKNILEFGDELARANATKPSLVHGDWHPGNMIFRGQEIVAACDFDNTRIGSRPREVAQAMIHFSLATPKPGENAQTCNPEPSRPALRAFWIGYRTNSASGDRCSARLCAGLMPAVMLDEALGTIASQLAGTSARSSAGSPNEQAVAMLVAVSRKAHWLHSNQSQLISLLESP